MKLAFSTLGCPNWTVEQAVAAASRFGYEAIEWRLADGELINSQTPAEIRARIVRATRQAGLEIACLDTSCAFVKGNREEREATVREAKHLVDMAAELGTTLLRVFGGAIPKGMNRAELAQPTGQALREAAVYAATKGVTVLLETHDDWAKSADALALVKAALKPEQAPNPSRPALSILWDVMHPYRMGEPPRQTLANLQEWQALSHVHIKDARRDPADKDKWRLTLLEEGEIPVREMIGLLRQARYTGYISVEWEKKWHPEIEEPEVALPQYAGLLRAYLS